MKKLLFLAISLCGLVIAVNAQKGATLLAEFAFTSDQSGTIPTTLTNAGTESGVSLTLISSTAVSSRSNQGYSYAMKNGGIELSGDLTSIGSFEMAVQNGSSGNVAIYTVSVWNGSAWIVAETLELAGNASLLYKPTTVVTKSAAKIKVTSSHSSWFYGLKVYNNTNADGAPAFQSATPAAGANLPGSGDILLQFDELIKPVTTAAVSLGDATITAVQNLGNTLKISYTGLTASPILQIAAANITDYSDVPATSNIDITYVIDVTPPVFQSILPTSGSTIHINDLGEDARKIKLTFDEDIKTDNTKTISFNGAALTSSVSGKVLTISYSGLAYDATNTLTIPAGFVTDLSGNEWAGDNYTYTTGSRDATAPVKTAQSIADGATTQSVGGSISFTFDEIVVVKAQTATINGAPVKLSNNGNVIGLNYTNLPYNTEAEVIIPAAAVSDTCGNVYAGTSFKFTTETKATKAITCVVAADGSEAYTKIQDAINAINNDAQRTLIYVKAGRYEEKLVVWKNNVSIIGEDADKVIITWNECASTSTLQPQYSTGINSTGTDASYTMLIKGSNFYGENFTVRNDYDNAQNNPNEQGVAIEHITGDKHVLKNVKMYGFQDTYYPKSANIRQYVTDSYILGGTDFIFGSGTCFINNTTIDCFPGGQYITAASDTQKEFGIIINNSQIQYADTSSVATGTKRQFNLGRPWKVPAKTSYINCAFESGLITTAGWAEWSGTDNHLSADYAEYNSTLQGGGALPTAGRVAWSKQLTADQAARHDFDNAFNYGANNVWNPLPYCTAPAAPVVTVTKPNDYTFNFSWDEVEFAAGYLIFLDGEFFNYTTETESMVQGDFEAGEEDRVRVKAYNAYGATSAASNSPSTGIAQTTVKTGFLKNTLVSTEVELKNPADFTQIDLLDVGGQKVLTAKVSSANINISTLPAGVYLAKGFAANGELYLDKIVKK